MILIFIRPIESFHTPGARLGYTLQCDCCLRLLHPEQHVAHSERNHTTVTEYIWHQDPGFPVIK